MKKVLFSIICFLFSGISFAQENSSSQSFFDYLVSRKTIKAEYRHQFYSESKDGKVHKFTRTPHFRIDVPVDIFGGIINATTKLRVENRAGKGYVKQPEFDLTSPYLNFESDIFTAGLSVSYLFPLNEATDKVNLNTSVGLSAPKFDTVLGSLSLSTGVDSTIYFKTYNQTVKADVTPEQIGRHADNTPFFLVQQEGSNEEPKASITTQRPDFEVNFTLVKAKLDTSFGLYTSAVAEYLNYYIPQFTMNNNDGSKESSWAVERASKLSWEVGYKLNDSITIANTVSFGFNGLFADKLPEDRSILNTETGVVKVADTIGIQFKL